MALPSSYEMIRFLHLTGVAMGAGAAFVTDAVFMHMIKGKVFEKVHVEIISIISKVVWLGVSIILGSGLLLFISESGDLLANPQFFAKMTVVAIILVNGTLFHFSLLPVLKRLSGKPTSTITKIPGKREMLLVSGAFSSSSWVYTIFLGSTLYRHWSYFLIMGLYVVIIGGAISTSLFLRDKIIPTKN